MEHHFWDNIKPIDRVEIESNPNVIKTSETRHAHYVRHTTDTRLIFGATQIIQNASRLVSKAKHFMLGLQ